MPFIGIVAKENDSNFIKNEISDELEISKTINYLKNKNKLTFIIDVQNLDCFFSLGFKIELYII